MNILGFELDRSALWLLTGGGSLVLLYLAHVLTQQRDKRRDKRNNDIAAFATFRMAVLSALSPVYPEPVNWPNNVDSFFKARFDALQLAVENVRPFITDKSGFEQAWVSFHNAYPGKQQGQWYHHYHSSFDPLVGTQELAELKARTTFHKNVTHLLSFAKDA